MINIDWRHYHFYLVTWACPKKIKMIKIRLFARLQRAGIDVPWSITTKMSSRKLFNADQYPPIKLSVQENQNALFVAWINHAVIFQSLYNLRRQGLQFFFWRLIQVIYSNETEHKSCCTESAALSGRFLLLESRKMQNILGLSVCLMNELHERILK